MCVRVCVCVSVCVFEGVSVCLCVRVCRDVNAPFHEFSRCRCLSDSVFVRVCARVFVRVSQGTAVAKVLRWGRV